jgi:alpha-beta hydrolase superfamily lysophospholipase
MFMSTNNIVLVHGLWMTPLSWEYWAHHYTERGYSVFAPSWPGMERDIRALRRAPQTYADIGVRQIVDHYEKLVVDLEEPPILIGHSFGGLVVQELLDRGLGACGVAIASAPIKGVWTLPYSTIRVVTPQLINPRNNHRCVPLTPAQFHYAFMNTSDREESFRVYQRYAVPGPDHVLFQAELANFNPFSETAVNVRRNNRAPLLMIAGSKDHVIPPSVVKANVKRYRYSQAVTDYKEFPDRTHFIVGQTGWQEVANYALDWCLDQQLIIECEQKRALQQLKRVQWRQAESGKAAA